MSELTFTAFGTPQPAKIEGSGASNTGQAQSLLGANVTPPKREYRNPRAHIGQPERVTIEQIVSAYRETGSVWKAARQLGICGQSVWERLKAVDYPMQSRRWTKDEYEELARLSDNCTISTIANRLGRPYYAVAIKLSRLGLTSRFGNRQKMKVPRGTGLNKQTMGGIAKKLAAHTGTLRQFCKMHSQNIDTLVAAMQTYEPEAWRVYSAAHGQDLGESECPYCHAVFYPMTAKQKTCSRKCSATAKRDEKYFGGRRRDTVGLSAGICQLCNQEKTKGLSSHHVLGKENDPDNTCLVALCQGCHQLVGQLAGRKFVDDVQGWENLIQLVMGRRMAEKSKEFVGVYAFVEMEHLTIEDLEDMTAEDEAA